MKINRHVYVAQDPDHVDHIPQRGAAFRISHFLKHKTALDQLDILVSSDNYQD